MDTLEARLADNPFPGLRSFQADEADVFFGRQQQVDELLARLADVPLIAVAGASGCGKSSLVLAGLLNALKQRQESGHALRWRPVVMRPGDAPITNLAKPLAAALVGDEPEAAADDGTRASALAGRLHLGADALVQAVRRARLPPNERVLVVVDQFEEIFRYKRMSDPEECVAFVKLLLQASRAEDCPLKVVLTLRSDALGSCADFRGLPEAVSRGQFLVPRLTREQRKQAIVGPVEHRGCQIAPRLVQRVLNDVSDDFDDLPVMQHALACTWRRWAADAQGSRPLDMQDYEAIGTSERALSQHADEAYDSLPGLGAVVERVFRALTERLDAAGSEVRRPMHFTRLCQVTGDDTEQVARVVERYRRADTVFLLPSASTPLKDDPLIDIAHESLIRGWTKLKGWAEREALSAQAYYRIANAAKPVDGQPPAFLRDPGLQFALDWREQNRPNAHWAALYDEGFEQAMAFLEDSRRARDAERAAATRTSRRRKWIAVGVTLGSLALAVVMGVLSNKARQSAEDLRAQEQQERARGDSRGLAFAAGRHLAASRLDAALVLGAGAMQPPAADEAQEIMRKVLLVAPRLILRDEQLAPPEAESPIEFNGLRFSPDGTRLAAVSLRGDVVAWDVVRGRRITGTWRSFDGEHGVLATYAADGTLLVSPDANGQAAAGDAAGALANIPLAGLAVAGAGRELTLDDVLRGGAIDAQRRRYARADHGLGIRVWDLRTGALLSHLPEAADDAARLMFSDDGRSLAALRTDSGVQVWDVSEGRAPRRAVVHIKQAAKTMAMSRDGQFIALAGADGVVVWDLQRGAPTRRLRALGGTVEFLAFGASSRVLAWGQSDGQVMVWDLDSPAEPSPWAKQHKGVSSLAFSSDGQQLATGDDDGVIVLWSVNSSGAVLQVQLERRLRDWSRRVERLAFSSDGKQLASAHRDGTVLVRAAAPGGVRHGEFQAALDAMSAVAFDPAGGRLAMASEDSSIQFWDLASGRLRPESLRGHEQGLTSIAFSADGAMLASGSADNLIQLWNARSGEPAGKPLAGHSRQVRALAFSPDGSLLASAGDNNIIVWEVSTRRLLWRQARHGREAMALAFSPDGKQLASAGREGAVVMWTAMSGQALWQRELEKVEVYALAFSPRDGRTLAAGARGMVAFWNAQDGAPGKSIDLPGMTVRSIAFDGDGQRLVSGADDGMVRLWDVQQRKPIGQPFEGHDKVVTDVAFSPDGKTVASVGADRRIVLWDADQSAWPQRACAIVQQDLKADAWPRSLSEKSDRRSVCAP